MLHRSTLVALLAFSLPAFAKLEIKDVQPSQGLLGPARESDDVYPLDEYFVRYQVTGIKSDKDGKADLEVRAKLVGPDGKVIFDRKSPAVERPLSLGGDSLRTFGSFTIPERAPLGDYKLTVTVRDRTASESASFEQADLQGSQVSNPGATLFSRWQRQIPSRDGRTGGGDTALFVQGCRLRQESEESCTNDAGHDCRRRRQGRWRASRWK